MGQIGQVLEGGIYWFILIQKYLYYLIIFLYWSDCKLMQIEYRNKKIPRRKPFKGFFNGVLASQRVRRALLEDIWMIFSWSSDVEVLWGSLHSSLRCCRNVPRTPNPNLNDPQWPFPASHLHGDMITSVHECRRARRILFSVVFPTHGALNCRFTTYTPNNDDPCHQSWRPNEHPTVC